MSDSLSVALVSLGCPKNLVDSEKMLACLAEGGLIVGAPTDDADVIIVNTCGFLAAARDESLEVIEEALTHKRRGRTKRVVVAGCLVNRDAEDLFAAAEGIDAIVGVHNRQDILAAVAGRGRITQLDTCPAGPARSDTGRFRLTARHTAYLRISEGCSRRCTYCTIPALRGPLRSKPPADVLTEARELVADGAIEVNLIAQDTTAYGDDLTPTTGDTRATLAGLLRSLNELEPLRRLRLLYAYPHRFSDDLIAAMAECPRVVPYVDIPLQHVSAGVLSRMGRPGSHRQIEDLLGRLRDRIHGLAIRTTLIAGFPGETEREFQELLAFVKAARFNALGVFAFSPEPGTAAAEMDGQIDDAVRTARAEEIMLAQQEIAFAANRGRIGERVEILVDGVDAEGYCIGRTSGQAPEIDSICILTEPREAGTFLAAKVADWRHYDLIVEPE